jgi:agmatinase
VTHGRPPREDEGPRFGGLRTFMRLPFGEEPIAGGLAVLGAPFDIGTSYRPGARFGPAAMRDASSGLYPYHYRHGLDVFARLPGVDLGDAVVTPGETAKSLAAVEALIGRCLAAGAVPIVLGGDHTVTLPELRAHRRVADRPPGLIHLDSHSDLWDTLLGGRVNHGTHLRRALEEGLFDPARSVQVGLRGSGDEAADRDQGASLGLDVVTCEDMLDMGPAQTAGRIRDRVGDGPVVFSLDIDVVDPAFAPGTGTPEVGGPTSRQVLDLVRGLAGIRLVGADVVEVAPPYDPAGLTSLLGATLAFEFMALAALAAA